MVPTTTAVIGECDCVSLDQAGAHQVLKRQRPEESTCAAPAERRLQSREDVDSMDWETKVVRRVERHVELLLPDSSQQLDTSHELGWEEASVLALRHRIEDLKSE